jgi:hypothetical protein
VRIYRKFVSKQWCPERQIRINAMSPGSTPNRAPARGGGGGGHTGQHDNRAMPEITSDSGNDPLPTAPIQHELKRKPRYFLGTFWLAITVLLGAVGFTNPAGAWWCILLAIATFAYSIYLYRGGRYGFWFF